VHPEPGSDFFLTNVEEYGLFMSLVKSEPLNSYDTELDELFQLHQALGTAQKMASNLSEWYGSFVRQLEFGNEMHYFLLSNQHEHVMLHVKFNHLLQDQDQHQDQIQVNVCQYLPSGAVESEADGGNQESIEAAARDAISLLVNNLLQWMWRQTLLAGPSDLDQVGS